MKAFWGMFARVGALVCLVVTLGMVSAPSVFAQGTASPADTLTGSSPKDALTRAKLHTELGSMYFQEGNFIVALEELTIAISINPNYAPAYSTRALVLHQIRELDSAGKDFRKALELDERDPEINNNYGWFLCETGHEKEALDYFQKAIRNPLYRTPEVAHLNAGACYAKIGDLDTAEDYIRRTLRFSPDNARALYQLAAITYKRGNYDAAREHLTKITRTREPNAETLWLLLRTERRLGDRIAENSLAAQLRRNYPDSPEYRELLKGNFE
ncbi:type IV pilus biogenesis/stability protein PilW [Propionivibrio soli]|uniref:type IV pilus biogenesis/stability protein PilW n=1 Tax=Propionivibrio soli TaxID=2976531 RepID=UPI0021E6E17F|nr:type IV pilus biogenesis/stability protein PilW [Propionivibrio soli]